MNVIIHDLSPQELQRIFPTAPKDTLIISDSGTIKNCIGCFGCWIKSPGACIRRDSYSDMGAILSRADRVILISQCCYGGYSPFVKNVLDRSISYLLPLFQTIKNETHHRQRYRRTFRLSVFFYGENITSEEKETAENLVAANSVNFYAHAHDVTFLQTIRQINKEDIICTSVS